MMKRFTGIAALLVLLVFAGNSAMAQSFKFGHINSEELITALPAIKQKVWHHPEM